MSLSPRSRLDSFASLDWVLLTTAALMWGASFLLIDLSLDALHPATVAWLRLVFGSATLACFPAARRAVSLAAWRWIGLLGLVWMAVPFFMFAVAQQWIASSLAGMINGAAPLFTAAIGALWYRRAPRSWQLAGLLLGFAGVATIYAPAISGVHVSAVGAGLIVLATFMYGIAFNLAEPLERRNGALPVIWRAELVAALVLTPFGLYGLGASSLHWPSVAATAGLGVFSTGAAFAAFAALLGRVGASRGSITVYFVPVVAIVLGILFRGESVTGLALLGTALVLVGAYLTSRREPPLKEASLR